MVSATQRSATSRVLKDKCKFGPPPFSGSGSLPQITALGNGFASGSPQPGVPQLICGTNPLRFEAVHGLASQPEVAEELIPPVTESAEALVERPDQGDDQGEGRDDSRHGPNPVHLAL